MNVGTEALQAVLDSFGEGVAISDASGKLVTLNSTARRFFDAGFMTHPPDDWPKSFGLFAPDGRTPFPVDKLPLVRAIRGESSDSVEIFVRNRRLPRGRWISITGRPLRDRKGRLIGGVAVFRDVTEIKKAEREIVEISGREQRRIGQDLHDGLCQILLGAQFTAKVLEEHCRNGSQAAIQECLSELLSNLSQALAQSDIIARGLYPVELDTQGLMAALEEMTLHKARLFRVDCRFLCPQPVSLDSEVVSTHVYRIAQEAVTNAIKGGKASKVHVVLTHRRNGYRLEVQDNGSGLPRGQRRKGMGLRLMAYRARLINTELTFLQPKTGGTTVRLDIPRVSPDVKVA